MDRGVQHLGVAIRQDRQPRADAFEVIEHVGHFLVGFQRPVGGEKLFLEPGLNAADRGDRVVEALLGEQRKGGRPLDPGVDPGVLELFGPPDRAQQVGFRSDFVFVAADRRMDVEQRTVGVEDEDRRCHRVEFSQWRVGGFGAASRLPDGITVRSHHDAKTGAAPSIHCIVALSGGCGLDRRPGALGAPTVRPRLGSRDEHGRSV